MSNLEIRKIIEVNAPTDIVFKALTDMDELVQWWPDKGTFEPKVGGKIHFEFDGNNFLKPVKAGQVLDGEILEFVQDKKIVYTFEPHDPYNPKIKFSEPTRVCWILDKIAENKTKVTLVHSGFTDETSPSFKGTAKRWQYFVTSLLEYCNTQPRGIIFSE